MIEKPMANAEHAEIIEHAEKPADNSGIFRLFRYFRVLRRSLQSPQRKETIL
jgi:hypothetical protein